MVKMVMPLEDIKVIDMTRLAPGPFCTMILGDLGADVLRVEQPGGGRRAQQERAAGVSADERRWAAFNALGRNKRSVALDLKHPEAQRILQELAKGADVFLEGFRPGVVKRLACDYETLAAINPRLVYCSLSGYGQDGPYRDLVGHDINYIAVGGALGLMGSEDGTPAIPLNIIGDYAAGGMHAAVGIMAALMARGKTGRGQYVDISMTDGVLYLLAAAVSDYLARGAVPRPAQHRLNGAAPYYNVYRCKDGGYIAIGCNEPYFWDALCKAVGCPEFIPHQYTVERYPEIKRRFGEVFLTRTRDEWWDYLRSQGEVAVAKVYSLDEALEDPQMQARAMVVEAGRLDGEPVRQVGIGPRLSATPGHVRSPGPLPGQHTDAVLASLGYTPERVRALREQGVVG
ncbi:MAG: CoA transferase [Chloroflexi bacterium]|nr:CoA transferase [Chloroflexota bacterium]